MEEITCFKAYDVRGRIPDQRNEDIARRIGISLMNRSADSGNLDMEEIQLRAEIADFQKMNAHGCERGQMSLPCHLGQGYCVQIQPLLPLSPSCRLNWVIGRVECHSHVTNLKATCAC